MGVVSCTFVISAPSATCTHHPLREAIGICVQCRRAMCSDCITKIDGINHCRSCLESVVSAQASRAGSERGVMPGWLAISLGLVFLSGLSYLMLDVLMPGSSTP